jgi:hypothetical protein
MEGEFAIVIPSFELLSPESNTKDEIPMDTDSLLQMIDDLRAYPVRDAFIIHPLNIASLI